MAPELIEIDILLAIICIVHAYTCTCMCEHTCTLMKPNTKDGLQLALHSPHIHVASVWLPIFVVLGNVMHLYVYVCGHTCGCGWVCVYMYMYV